MGAAADTLLLQRAADVRRRRLQWFEGSPPGLYWNGDNDEYQLFVLKGIQQDAIQGDSLESLPVDFPAADAAIGQIIETTTYSSDSGSESAPSLSPPTPISGSDDMDVSPCTPTIATL